MRMEDGGFQNILIDMHRFLSITVSKLAGSLEAPENHDVKIYGAIYVTNLNRFPSYV